MRVEAFIVFVIAFVSGAFAAMVCPDPLRMTMPDGTIQTVRVPCPPIPSLPSLPPRPSPRPRPRGTFTVKTKSLKVIKSDDGFLRGCADPLIYVLYGRVIPGVVGSTIGRKLPRVDYGEGKCSGRFIRKVGAVTTDFVRTDKVSLAVYVVVGIEEDNFGTSTVNDKLNGQLKKVTDLLRKLEATPITPSLARLGLDFPSFLESRFEIPEIKKPSSGLFSVGHDFVGFNALILVGGSGYSGQPSVCSRAEFPICATKDLFKGIVVGGKFDDNIWRADVEVDAV